MRQDAEDRIGIRVGRPHIERSDLRGVARIIVTGAIEGAGSQDERLALRQGLQAATDALGQRWEEVDLADGCRLVMAPDMAALPAVLDAFVTNVDGGLGDGGKVRLSVHFGFLNWAAGVWSGTPLVHAARLVNAAEAGQRLRDTEGARLAVVVSEYVHGQLVRQRCAGIRPEAYQRFIVVDGETMAPAWLRIV
jgi:hypothetical protein